MKYLVIILSLNFLTAFEALADAETTRCMFSAKEEIACVDKQSRPMMELGMPDSFVGLIFRKLGGFRNLNQLKLFLYPPLSTPLDRDICRKLATDTFFLGPHVSMKVDRLTMVASVAGKAASPLCDIKLTDVDPDYQERHLVVFNLAGKTYGVAALFPAGSSQGEIIDLLNFVKGISPLHSEQQH